MSGTFEERRTSIIALLRTTFAPVIEPVPGTHWPACADVLIGGPLGNGTLPAYTRRNQVALILRALFSDEETPITEPEWYLHADVLLAEFLGTNQTQHPQEPQP
jgi:hypothetical protein